MAVDKSGPDLVSVIIPVYNSQQYLRKCVASVSNQTYRSLQIILVNDGSTDHSLEICEELAAEDSRIQIIDRKNGGVSSARNAGLTAAAGDFIIFVDSDDFVEPVMCSSLMNAAGRCQADLVLHGVSCFDRSGKTVSFHIPREEKLFRLEDFSDSFDQLFQDLLIHPPFNKLYRRTLIRHHFSEQLSLGEDLLFNLDYLKGCRTILTVPACFYHYRVNANENSLSSQYRENGFSIAFSQYQAVRSFKESVWRGENSAYPESYKLISDSCTNAERLVRRSSDPPCEIRRILKDYFDRSAVRKAFRLPRYRESNKYRIYKILLRHRLYRSFCCFAKTLGIFKRFFSKNSAVPCGGKQ